MEIFLSWEKLFPKIISNPNEGGLLTLIKLRKGKLCSLIDYLDLQ